MSMDPTKPDQGAIAATREILAELTKSLLTIPYSPHVPHPKQAQFLLDFSREVLYGGAAGGGKSDALLMGALQFVEVPSYAALILRKSFADLSLPGAIMDRADEWLRPFVPEVRWNEQSHSWTFPSGASLSFGYIQNKNDRLKYQGAEFHYVGFDEVTQFRESDYRYLLSRIRRPKDRALAIARVPLRIRAATNPGGPGHHWVYNRWVAAYEARERKLAEMRTEIVEGIRVVPGVDPDSPELVEAYLQAWKAASTLPRAFYPATIFDNPSLDAEEYLGNLAELDPVTRAQLEAGNWNIRPEGRLFKRDWFEIVQVADVREALGRCHWLRYWDCAATEKTPDKDPDWTAGLLLGRDPRTGTFYITDVQHFRASPYETEARVLETSEGDRVERRAPIYMEQEPGSSGKSIIAFYRRKLLRCEFEGHLPSGDKIQRARPVASKAQAGMIKVVAGPWVTEFLDEVEIFPDGEHDDQVDALSGAFDRLAARTEDWAFDVAAEGIGQINAFAMQV